MKKGIGVVGLLMDLFEVIKFDSIIPLPALAKRRSQNGFTFEKDFKVIFWRMNGRNTRTIG